MVERILVIGCPASGKSTMAGKLAARAGLPLVSLDDLFFGKNWSLPHPDVWVDRVDRCIAEPRWVIDGNHQSTFDRRLARADCVVFIDRPPVLCALSYLRRALRLKVAAVCGADPDQFPHYMRAPGGIRVTSKPVRFLVFILRFGSLRRQLDGRLADFPGTVVRIRSLHEVDRALVHLEKATR